jgi:hypothetical protein
VGQGGQVLWCQAGLIRESAVGQIQPFPAAGGNVRFGGTDFELTRAGPAAMDKAVMSTNLSQLRLSLLAR